MLPIQTHSFQSSPYGAHNPVGLQSPLPIYGPQSVLQWLQVLPQQIQQLQQISYAQQQQLQQLLQIVPAQLQQLQQVIQYVPQQLQQLLQIVAQQQFGASAQGVVGAHQGFGVPFQTLSPFGAPFAGTSAQVM